MSETTVISSAASAADALVDRVRARPWGVAVAAVCGDDVDVRLDPGVDPLSDYSLFQFGSISKTFAGLLLGDLVARGRVALDATVQSILGSDAGAAARVTLLELATQRSGLPRLPPNLNLQEVDRRDPYAEYSELDLLVALRAMPVPVGGKYQYSNFGFMLLGHLLTRIADRPFADLVETGILKPLGMKTALCGTAEPAEGLPCYDGASRVPWWRTQLPGAGGMAGSIRDLVNYVRGHLCPPTELAEAIRLATAEHAPAPSAMGLGWVHQGGGLWHNGATGGFRSFVAFHAPTLSAVALLANGHDAESVDRVGFAVLTELVRSRL